MAILGHPSSFCHSSMKSCGDCAKKMAQEAPGHTLQATALVHEAYLRLVDSDQRNIGIVADISLQPQPKRCGGFSSTRPVVETRTSEEAKRPRRIARIANRCPSFLATRCSPSTKLWTPFGDPVAASLVKLRYFAGLNMNETAAALGISVRKGTSGRTPARGSANECVRVNASRRSNSISLCRFSARITHYRRRRPLPDTRKIEGFASMASDHERARDFHQGFADVRRRSRGVHRADAAVTRPCGSRSRHYWRNRLNWAAFWNRRWPL